MRFVVLVWLIAGCGWMCGSQDGGALFEVATVRMAAGADPASGSWSPPGTNRFMATHVTLERLLELAYGLDRSQIAQQPAWMGTMLYDVNAKPAEGVRLSREELRPRLQALLKQRFHLAAHWETRRVHGYALVVAKGGPHLTATTGDHFAGFRINVSSGQMRGLNWSMATLAKYLSGPAEFPVVDETGISGSYDIGFSYNPGAETEGSTLAPLARALTEATGLALKAEIVPVETLVIDAVDKVPTEN